ncbi:MAG: IS110 family transposase [Pseudomonadota bacterium]
MAKKKQSGKVKNLLQQVCHPDAVGIDLGAEEFYAAISPETAQAAGLDQSVKMFTTFNSGIREAIEWFAEHGVKTIAMESTGNYWCALYDQLSEAGFEVFLVNAGHCKSLPGRKTDVCDAQWIQQLHTAGLLKKSYIPEDDIRAIRYLMRHRDKQIKNHGSEIQHMQKALTEMNVQLHHILSDIDGWSGQRIIEAIINGERDLGVLTDLRHPACRTARDTVIAALDGNFRPEYLFALKQSFEKSKQIKAQIAEVEAELDRLLSKFSGAATEQEELDPAQSQTTDSSQSPKKHYQLKTSGNGKRELNISFIDHARAIYRVDLSTIPGVADGIIGCLLTEVGDASAFKSFENAQHFASWLGLCPDNRITGRKVKRTKTRKVDNPLAVALRIAAQTLWRSDNALGDYSRKMKARLGKPEGITATAHKLARIIYAVITTGQPYDEAAHQATNPRNLKRQIKNLEKKAAKLGLTLSPITDLEVAPNVA